MVQIYRADELPPDVPGMIITDGDETAVLLNPAFMQDAGSPFMQNVANALLAEADTHRQRLNVAV